MSGDVQPRKRKDKRRKRDEDESSHGVHITKMGSDDVHLHVQEEHGTGGHWCAKVFFFALLTVLLGLIALIVLENRGVSDLDTPLSESRFSNYFDGWVDENRAEHDEHDAVQASIEEHDDHDEPFEEEEDLSEIDEHVDHDDEEDEEENVHDHEEDEENDEADNEDDDDEDEEDEQTKESQTIDRTQEDDGDNEELDNDQDNDDEEEDDERPQTEEDEKDDGEDEDKTAEENDENTDNDEYTLDENKENNDDDNDDADNDDDNAEEDEDDVEEPIKPIYTRSSQQATKTHQSKPNSVADEDEDPFDEEDDDGTFESLEPVVVDNDAEELLLLQEKARQQAAEASKNQPPNVADDDDEVVGAASSWASSQIKPKQTPGAGPQAVDTDDEADLFDQELRRANEEMLRENYQAALQAFSLLSKKYADKPQVFLGYARTFDKLSEQQQSNKMLVQALEAYKRYLAFGELIEDDNDYRTAAERCIERTRFIGYHNQAVDLHAELINRFPDVPQLRNDLAVTYLLVNRLAEAKLVLQHTLQRWPTDGFAQVHYGFVLKQLDKDYANAVVYLEQGIRSKAEGTQDGRFYFNLGDALQRLGRPQEALKIYEQGAALKLFPSVYQRSLYNVPHLKAQAFWTKGETTYREFFEKLEQNWLAIRAEGLSLLTKSGYFVDESENLRDTGEWKQFELYARGQRSERNCRKAPITCDLIEHFTAASGCRRGQVKFSVMHPGTHVWPHCGPTNCRLRAHLGLVVPQGTSLRVAKEERTWTEGEFLIFDDSFEHEVWHNGTSLRLVLIIDVWHPQLSDRQRRTLSPI